MAGWRAYVGTVGCTAVLVLLLLDVGGEGGGGAGPSGRGAPAAGIGQGEAAGIGPGYPAAAADPAVIAVLQEMLARNHAIDARLTCLENTQAHPQH